jgi:hypothetical protein
MSVRKITLRRGPPKIDQHPEVATCDGGVMSVRRYPSSSHGTRRTIQASSTQRTLTISSSDGVTLYTRYGPPIMMPPVLPVSWSARSRKMGRFSMSLQPNGLDPALGRQHDEAVLVGPDSKRIETRGKENSRSGAVRFRQELNVVAVDGWTRCIGTTVKKS